MISNILISEEVCIKFISMASMSILIFHQSNVELVSQKDNSKDAKIVQS